MTKLCELFELRSVKLFRSPNRAWWSGAAMADSVSLLRQSWFQGLVDVPAPRPLPPATTTNTICVSETFFTYMILCLVWQVEASGHTGQVPFFFHFIGEIIKIQKGSAAIPTSTPISHYTIKAASKVLSEFEMKFSICMLPHVRLPSYKMFTGTMYSPLYPELSMVLTEVTLKNVCWINELGNNPFFLNYSLEHKHQEGRACFSEPLHF